MKTIYLIITIFFITVLALSCEDLNSYHQKYLDEGEIIYAKKVDSVQFFPGYNRLKLNVYADSISVSRLLIKSMENPDTSYNFILAKENIDSTGKMVLILEKLSEGVNLLKLFTYDKYDNISLPFEKSTKTYGEFYAKGLVERKINSQRHTSGEYEVKFLPPLQEDLRFTFIEYAKTTGKDTVVKVLFNNYSYIKLTDFDINKECRYKSAFLPDTLAIDTLYSEYTVIKSDLWNK